LPSRNGLRARALKRFFERLGARRRFPLASCAERLPLRRFSVRRQSMSAVLLLLNKHLRRRRKTASEG